MKRVFNWKCLSSFLIRVELFWFVSVTSACQVSRLGSCCSDRDAAPTNHVQNKPPPKKDWMLHSAVMNLHALLLAARAAPHYHNTRTRCLFFFPSFLLFFGANTCLLPSAPAVCNETPVRHLNNGWWWTQLFFFIPIIARRWMENAVVWHFRCPQINNSQENLRFLEYFI